MKTDCLQTCLDSRVKEKYRDAISKELCRPGLRVNSFHRSPQSVALFRGEEKREKQVARCFARVTEWLSLVTSDPFVPNLTPYTLTNGNLNSLKQLFFLSFLRPLLRHMEVPRLGSNRSCSHWPMPEPQQLGIRAESATYTTAHGNARSLTH